MYFLNLNAYNYSAMYHQVMEDFVLRAGLNLILFKLIIEHVLLIRCGINFYLLNKHLSKLTLSINAQCIIVFLCTLRIKFVQ